ncbi:MAG: GntR family transcriptional regulator [Neomegalonema sp.]|nr:GntR family transcriptional regulator [Neomegalonema sp.]
MTTDANVRSAEKREEQDADPAMLADLQSFSGSLAQRVYLALSDAILSMRYSPGATLRKAAICARLGVSRSPVSEAIARLAAEGLVDVVPQSGSRVSPLSMPEIREAAFMREALELAAVARVAALRTDAELAQLARSIRMQEMLADDGDDAGLYAEDEAFHALIMSFTGYRNVASTVATVSLQLRRARLLLLPEDGRAREVVAEHRKVLDAITAQDPDAAVAAMRAHLGHLIPRVEPLEKRHPEFFRPR